ncbi:MAG TPA: hypothetical protein VK390_14015 [Propionibacteriaceae bacterium]|nr:hypothetical protein [Propionibacteriaceae bacterium]
MTSYEIQELADLFVVGTPKIELAARFGISLSSVKRLLRQRGVRRN